jgi:alpha-ribazole phosphatase/probable phosphoglycerate mutase
MKLIWVRHGETLWNREYRLQGLSNVALSERGQWQAERLAAAFTEQPNYIFASPLQRAQAFAAPLAARFALPVQVDDDLREMSFGQWEGLRYADMEPAMQKQFEAWCNDPVTNIPPGGEGAAALAARVQNFLHMLTARLQENETAVIVTHGGIIRTAVTLAMEMPAAAAARLQIDTASVTILYYYNHCWYLAKLNDTCHLQER